VAAGFTRPASVLVDEDGTIYVSNRGTSVATGEVLRIHREPDYDEADVPIGCWGAVRVPVFSGGAGLSVQAVPATGASDEQRITTVVSGLENAWNAHDAKAFSMLFAKNADFTNVAGQRTRGRADIESFHAMRFATRFKSTRLTITSVSIRFIRADVASVDASWEMSGATSPQGEDVPLRKGILHLVVTKDGDAWLIAVMHNRELRASR